METTIKTNAAEAQIISWITDLASEAGIELEMNRVSIELWEVTINGVYNLVTLKKAKYLVWSEVFEA